MHLFKALVLSILLQLSYLSFAVLTEIEPTELTKDEAYNTTAIASGQWGYCTPGQLYCYNEIVYDLSMALTPFSIFLTALTSLTSLPTIPFTANFRQEYPGTELDRQYCRDEGGAPGCFMCNV